MKGKDAKTPHPQTPHVLMEKKKVKEDEENYRTRTPLLRSRQDGEKNALKVEKN